MAGIIASLDSEFLMQRTRLPRVTPFPSWNGVLRYSSDGLITVMSECGRVYLLRLNASPASEIEDALTVVQIIESSVGDVMSMCQAWTRGGDVLVVARDRQLSVYRLTDATLQTVATASLRFAATSIDVMEEASGDLLLVVGCAAGVMVFTVNGSSVSQSSTFLDEVAVAVVKFSPDTEYVAIGTIDGRVMVLRRTCRTFSALDSASTFVKVLAAPRVTSLSFSPTSDKLIAATRKGSVYVLKRDAEQWSVDNSFEALVANPKGGATSQTLSCWWGTTATPIFAIAGRSSSSSIEVYDAYSSSLLHRLEMQTKPRPDIETNTHDSTDRHLMGVVCVQGSNETDAPRLFTIDSDANVSIITWPFLTHACPR